MLEVFWDKASYIIEEDIPDIGVYLYCFIDGRCVSDYLQNSVDECKAFASEKFGIPLENWQERVSRSPRNNKHEQD